MIFKHAALACHNRSSRGIFPETQWPPLSPFCATKASNSGRNEKKKCAAAIPCSVAAFVSHIQYILCIYIYIHVYTCIYSFSIHI